MTELDAVRLADRCGRIFALTMMSAIRPFGRLWLAPFLTASRYIPQVASPLRRLGFIRAAHWTIVHALPDEDGVWRPLRPPYLLFESNFDFNLKRYIEVVIRTLPWHGRGVWSTSVGYPGVLPTDPFYLWVEQHRHYADHYWCAYPEATTRMTAGGLEVADGLRAFEAAVAGVDDATFAAEYRRMVTSLQRYL